MTNLYRVKIETDLMIVANSDSEAVEIAKKNAPCEIPVYGRGIAYIVKKPHEIPEDWKSVIPYSRDGQENRKCFEIVSDIDDKRELSKDEIDAIVKAKESSKEIIHSMPDVCPETRPDPKPKELDWHETKSGRPMKSLRFIR